MFYRVQLMMCVVLWIGCAENIGWEADTQTVDRNNALKSHAFQLATDEPCYQPCTLRVLNEPAFVTTTVVYSIDGAIIAESENRNGDYEIAIPSSFEGYLTIKAQALDMIGRILATDSQEISVRPSDTEHAKQDAYSVTTELRIDNDGDCTNPCVLSANASDDVASVEYSADGYLLGVSTRKPNFAIEYEFSQLGVRSILAEARDSEGFLIAEDVRSLHISTVRPSLREVPYFSQYNNRLYPSATCQNTSIAMVLAYLGWQGIPDDLTSRYGKDFAQSPAGLAELFNTYATHEGFDLRLRPETNGTLDGLKAELDRGYPVIIHGYFTAYGHVMVVLDYDEHGYFVHDPAGRWTERFKGGYGGDGSGQNAYYQKIEFEAAVSTSDGFTFAPLWYHALY